MSDPVNLVKEKAEKVTVSLKKAGITKVPPLRVVADYDVSGSMRGLYQRGVVQKAADQVLGLGFKFDDDGQVDSFIFDSRANYVGTATVQDYGSFVQENILNHSELWNSTNYGACLQANIDFLFGTGVRAKVMVEGKKGLFGIGGSGRHEEVRTVKSEGKDPAVVFFFTDGSPDSGDRSAQIISEASKKGLPIYFNLIGVGGERFHVLQRLADDYDNCGFVGLSGFDMSDEALYDALVGTEEFTDFLKKHGAA
jgi:hypothetical protein